MKRYPIVAISMALFAVPAFAQAPTTKRSLSLQAACERNPASMACLELEKRGPAPRRIDDSTIPAGPGLGASNRGGGQAGGVTPEGNPATSGGGPRSNQ